MKKLLPIGTVVRLKGGEKCLMIIGILQEDEDGKRYDYLGCLFPEGYIDDETLFMFQQTDIEHVEFIGCINAQTQILMEQVKQAGLLEESQNEEEI